MFKIHLQNIKQDLKNHHRPKGQLITFYVQTRLNQSLKAYYSDLSNSAHYLHARKPDNILRKL